jgi:hypothetical protein
LVNQLGALFLSQFGHHIGFTGPPFRSEIGKRYTNLYGVVRFLSSRGKQSTDENQRHEQYNQHSFHVVLSFFL